MPSSKLRTRLLSAALGVVGLGLSACGGEGESVTPTSVAPAPANRAPFISGDPAVSVTANAAYEFTPVASDPDGDALTFNIINQPNWADFDTATGTLSGTPATSDLGAFADIQISVTDGQVSASLSPFSVTVDAAAVAAANLPPELAGLSMTLVHEDDFDDQPDFTTQAARSFCFDQSDQADCADLPAGWTDFNSWERWHPADLSDAKAGLQINANSGRGGTGKSLVIWDESRGTPSMWGSDAMIGKRFETGHTDIYAEMWLQYQPGYRWHHLEPFSSRGINYTKILRISNVAPGDYPFTYGASGTNGPMALADTILWAFDQNGERTDRGRADIAVRCAPHTTNYRCGADEVRGIQANLRDTTRFEERFGNNGEWHKIGLRMKLNSAPGVADGIGMLWVDDVLQASADNVTWLGADADPDMLLNMVTFGGNMHNYPEPEAERFEQWHAIDDVRIFAIEE